MTRGVATYAAIALLTALPPSCGNECDFIERCQGSVRQICGVGVDQCFNRKIRDEPCVAPNAACVAVGTAAYCVRSPQSRCDRTFAAYCEGSVLVGCGLSPEGFVVATDCSATGGTCRGGPREAACVRAD